MKAQCRPQAADDTAGRRPAATRGAHTGARRVLLGLTVIAVVIRLNNGVRFPSLHGYDSFGHLTYIWYLLKTGSVPLADQGWSFFHPPLYYAIAAMIWTPLRGVDPKQVLKVLSVTFSLLTLASAWVSYRVARRSFAHNPVAQLLAPAFVMFLPVCLYTAPMLGNEGLNTVLCSLAVYALIRTLADPGWRRALVLGGVLGLALLTKATAAAVFAAAVVSLAAWTIHHRRWRDGAINLIVVVAASSLICGWYYARNIAHFGTPLAMSRSYSFVAHVENALPAGNRGPRAYLSFDPHIFVNPRYIEPPVIDSVWSGIFGGMWFEVVGAALTPSVQDDAGVRWVARLLLVLGVVPTVVTLLGLGAGVFRSVRRGWDDTLVAMLFVSGMVVAMFIVFTHSVPSFTAVKASYLLPAIVPFSFWFALGIDVLTRWRRLLIAVLVEYVMLLGIIVPVFTYQLVFEAELSAFYWNALGVTYYLAGFPDSAKEIFSAVARGYHLAVAHENLAVVALEDGRPSEALQHLQDAMELGPEQIFGTTEDRIRLARTNVAEYRSTEAVIRHQLGEPEEAIAAARAAITLAPEIPEAHYNLAALLVEGTQVTAAASEVHRAIELDPTFTAARALLAVVEARRGACAPAIEALRSVAGLCQPERAYPWETGRGDLLDAGLARRRIIDLCTDALNPEVALRNCSALGSATVALRWLQCGAQH